MRGCEGVKPGWVRVNFNYFLTETVFDFLIEAVKLVAEHGWKLLPDYDFCPDSGLWRHRRGFPEPPMSLDNIRYVGGKMQYRARHATEPEWALTDYLAEAEAVFAAAQERLENAAVIDPSLSDDFHHLRWFPLPGEALHELRGRDPSEHGPVLFRNAKK